jgi:hypothetical protein
LKKASATLGLTKIRDAGEKIHPLGAGIDEPGITGGPDEDGPYEKIQTTLESAKEDYLEVEILLRGYCSKELDS